MCDFCKTGHYNLCAGMRFTAKPPQDGTLCHYYCHQLISVLRKLLKFEVIACWLGEPMDYLLCLKGFSPAILWFSTD